MRSFVEYRTLNNNLSSPAHILSFVNISLSEYNHWYCAGHLLTFLYLNVSPNWNWADYAHVLSPMKPFCLMIANLYGVYQGSRTDWPACRPPWWCYFGVRRLEARSAMASSSLCGSLQVTKFSKTEFKDMPYNFCGSAAMHTLSAATPTASVNHGRIVRKIKSVYVALI
jgi:hypothetical protein